jgi:two-component system nitrate/nitrite response regulator NarL
VSRSHKKPLVMASALAERRKGWARALADTFAVYEVSERRALEQVTMNLKPHFLVLDLMLPRLKGLTGLSHLQHLSPHTKILVLTEEPSETEGVAALKAGARGYCARWIDPPHLKKALEVIQNGEIWIQRKLISRLLAELHLLAGDTRGTRGRPRRASLGGLTARQRLVADLIGRGASNKDIASHLKITERTVKAHLTMAFRTLGVPDRLHLALLVKGALR